MYKLFAIKLFKKVKLFICDNWLTILAFIFLIPFILIAIGDNIYSYAPLYTFGIINIKDFFMFWIGLFGVFGVIYNIYQNQKRISQQDKQLKGQSTLLELQSKSERNTRFAKGVELLGNSQESARIGGIYDLYFLAKEFKSDYGKCVFDILCSHIITVTQESDYKKKYKTAPSNEIQTLLNILFRKQDDVYLFADYRVHLWGAYLNGANLINACMTKAYLENVSLVNANMGFCKLKNARIISTRMDCSKLISVDLSNAKIIDSNLSGTDLTRTKLNNANLDNVFLNYTTLKETFFESVRMMHIELNQSKIEKADFSKSVISDSAFMNTKIINTNLSKSHLQNVKITNAIICNTNLTCISFNKCDLTDSEIISSGLKHAYFYHTLLSENTLSKSDSTEAKIIHPHNSINKSLFIGEDKEA